MYKRKGSISVGIRAPQYKGVGVRDQQFFRATIVLPIGSVWRSSYETLGCVTKLTSAAEYPKRE
eukprot:CAMPEP_0183361770 /NCGR_PEP_ID=MMETSP0164_2-20130417/63818_1 /TAXON_ID=221442 /ORGANISM="Coccolithus pelagicus ssp braarudi, Strain PLY182g" /LENGTH=63 /DNA_ID=CAMNT_0025536455 /DNA_START=292 /DNA_END=483 /DNA_ORIENTATION=-